jgi:hypothetical protein
MPYGKKHYTTFCFVFLLQLSCSNNEQAVIEEVTDIPFDFLELFTVAVIKTLTSLLDR